MLNSLVLGDIIIDINKLSSDYNQKLNIYNIDHINETLGCAGNVIKNISWFYNEIYTIVCLNDNGHEYLKPFLNNIKYKYINQNDRKIIKKTRLYYNDKLILRYDEENIVNINKENEDKIISYIESIINKLNIGILSDYGKGFLTENLCIKIIELFNKYNKPIIVDPFGSNYNKYKNATFIKPNRHEAEIFYKKIFSNIENFSLYESKILNDLNIKYILTTLDKDGMIFSYKENNYIKNRNKKANIIINGNIYPVGCGDSIIAMISIILAKEILNVNTLLSILLEIGNKSVNEKKYILDKKTVNNILKDSYKNEIDLDKLLKINKSKKIAFTNGCFDIIHLGHLDFLKECKKYGDLLIIGINDDDSIKRLKGESRPINKLNDRINFLKKIGITNHIFSFSDDTPLDLIKKIKPYFLLKGSDYLKSEVVGSEYANKTLLIPIKENYSTTNLVNKCKN
jgi:D-beta-D-heptose 7-phosphate kinase / D-beta-D-heptose 1-phosphate adenosyltransferase